MSTELLESNAAEAAAERLAVVEPSVAAIPSREAAPRRKRWSRDEYYRLGELGLLPEQPRVERINGEILEMSPQHGPHATGVSLVEQALRARLPAGHYLRIQAPLAIGEESDPEPDIALVPGAPRDYAQEHPRAALLVAEVSGSWLEYDQTTKASVYAGAGIPEYWVLDLVHGRLEIRRDPAPLPGAPPGAGYRTMTLYLPGDTAAPLFAADSPIPVSDLLP